MRRYNFIASILLLMTWLAACAPAAAGTGPVTSAASDYHPLSVRTGLAEVDRVLDALASGQAQQLRSLLDLTKAKCTQADGLGGPPKCLKGESEGTLVEVLPLLGPEGGFLRKAEIERWPGVQAAGVYAIYKVSPDFVAEQYYPAGEYAVLLVQKDTPSLVVLRVRDGRIVRVDYPAGDAAAYLQAALPREAGTLLLPPLKR